jgi:hypothetical protein
VRIRIDAEHAAKVQRKRSSHPTWIRARRRAVGGHRSAGRGLQLRAQRQRASAVPTGLLLVLENRSRGAAEQQPKEPVRGDFDRRAVDDRRPLNVGAGTLRCRSHGSCVTRRGNLTAERASSPLLRPSWRSGPLSSGAALGCRLLGGKAWRRSPVPLPRKRPVDQGIRPERDFRPSV